jgi:preprotein translocase subunit SecA
MTDEFRGRLAQCDTKEERVEMLDDMLPEAFAAVRRQPTRSDSATSTSRSWVARPHFGWVAEMKTGEQGPRRHPASP